MTIIFKRKSIFTSFISAVVIILFLSNVYLLSAINYDLWSMSKEKVLKKNVPANGKYSEFTPLTKPKYKNKIMNYILALDSSLENNIEILRIGALPQRDFLLVKNKLYSIKESHNKITKKKLNEIIKKLAPKYGKAIAQKGEDIVTYTLSNKKTKVLIITHIDSRELDCTIYFYPSRLFKMLITDI